MISVISQSFGCIFQNTSYLAVWWLACSYTKYIHHVTFTFIIV